MAKTGDSGFMYLWFKAAKNKIGGPGMETMLKNTTIP